MSKARANADATSQAYIENATTAQELSGTYTGGTERLYFNDLYTLTGNVTIQENAHLALGTIADKDVTIEANTGSTERTITGEGTLESGRLMNDIPSLTGLTGELGSVVTGSPNLNLGNATGTIPSGVTGGSGLTDAPSPFTLSSANSGTAVNAKSFIGIPSWHRHIYLFINGFSFNDGADILMQLGYGATTFQSSGYTSTQTNAVSTQSTTTSGFGINVGSAGRACHGMSIFTRMNDTTYYWQCFMSGHNNIPTYAAGQAILSSGPATAIQIKGTTGLQDGGTVYAGWE